MGIFDDILRSNESVFRDTVALDYDYMPKIIKFRKKEQHMIASCIKPLFERQNGRNVLVYGLPGIGKTVATRHVMTEIEEHTDDIIPIYVNCWKKNTTYKILIEICDLIGYKFTHNKNTQELLKIIKEKLNKYSVVFCFDEVDKLEDYDFLYFLLEDIYRASIVMITNYKSWLGTVDERIRSRLTPQLIEFRPYNDLEIKDILKYRMGYAFVAGVWEDDAFNLAADKTVDIEDIRSGLYLLKEAGLCAEETASKKIKTEHVKKAIAKLEEFSIKNSNELSDDSRFILDVIRNHSENRIGDIFNRYTESGGTRSYKSLQRAIKKLSDASFVTIERVTGIGGNTSIISYNDKAKTLSDY